MAGTKEGAKKAAKTNLSRTEITIDGKTIKIAPGEFYAVAGSIGGKKSTTGGFYANRELAKEAGALGGKNSKRQWTAKERYEHGLKMKEMWELRRES